MTFNYHVISSRLNAVCCIGRPTKKKEENEAFVKSIIAEIIAFVEKIKARVESIDSSYRPFGSFSFGHYIYI